MKYLIHLFEIILCINFLFMGSVFFIKKILSPQKPSYQLFLARLLFLSCIASPIVIHFVNLPQKYRLNNMVPNHIIEQSYYHSEKSKMEIDESIISAVLKPKRDLTYLYISIFALFFVGITYRTYKIYHNINKTKSIIHSSHLYKKYKKITIKISDQCIIPFSVRFMRSSYIILPLSILHSSINTKLAIAHEGQHHRQGDCLWIYLIEFLRIIFWFNPFLNTWYKNFHELQELACDEAVIGKDTVSAHDYGSCLFTVTQAASQFHGYHQNHAFTAQMIFGHKNETSLITRRIRMLLKYKKEHLSKTMLGSIVAISVVSIIAPLGTAYATQGLISKDHAFDTIDTSSINPKIQSIAAIEISSAVNKSHAKSGAIIIADAHTGKIVAFAEAGKSSGDNSWSSRVFNPVSTIKPFIVAAAIDAGVASPSKTYDCHAPYQVDGKQFVNSNPESRITSIADAMVNSVNICMIKLAEETGSTTTRQVLSHFGFDMNAAWNKKNSDTLNLANAAMGSSIPVTLGTLTKAFTVLANQGHSIDSKSEQVVSVKTANTVTDLLEKVVTNGTGKRAALKNITVAGKTGTLRDDSKTSSLLLFAGYVPSHSSKYVSIVVMENAEWNGSMLKANGGNVAAPVFHNAFEKILASK